MRVLGIFAKEPKPGAVKTRLARDIGDAAAAAFYEACLNDLVERFIAIADQRWMGYAPLSNEAATYFQKLVNGRYQLWPQPDGDLGQRIEAFFTAAISGEDFKTSSGGRGWTDQREGSPGERAEDRGFAEAAPAPATPPLISELTTTHPSISAVLIGSDSPTLPTDMIDAAFVALQRTDIVLGPAADGGYYLIGARCRLDGWLDCVRWSTPWTLADTVDAAERHGLSLSLLPVWYDIDTADDLAAMWGHLRGQRACDPTIDVTRCEAWLSDWVRTR
ncbi:MAG: glycosyltransferase [Planctomycetaceae bacterium]|nr:glycosyltransferase [Planctomycetaceae bacterium]